MPSDSEKEIKKKRFEDLTPELQDMIKSFVSKDKLGDLNKGIDNLLNLLNGVRTTVAYTPPDAPVSMKELYIDQAYPLPQAYTTDKRWKAITMIPSNSGDGSIICTCTIIQSANQTIFVQIPDGSTRNTFVCDTKTPYNAWIVTNDGFRAGTLNVPSSGTIYGDMVFSASPAVSLSIYVRAVPIEHGTNQYQFNFTPTMSIVRVSFTWHAGRDERGRLNRRSECIYNAANGAWWFNYNGAPHFDGDRPYCLVRVTPGKRYTIMVRSSNYKGRNYGFILECNSSIGGATQITDL